MPAKLEVEPQTVVAYLSGEIDHHNAAAMREEIDGCVRCNLPKELILDFKTVEFMDSSGIGIVLGRYRLMQEVGGKLILRNMPGHIRRVMRVAGIENLDIRQSREDEKNDDGK